MPVISKILEEIIKENIEIQINELICYKSLLKTESSE